MFVYRSSDTDVAQSHPYVLDEITLNGWLFVENLCFFIKKSMYVAQKQFVEIIASWP